MCETWSDLSYGKGEGVDDIPLGVNIRLQCETERKRAFRTSADVKRSDYTTTTTTDVKQTITFDLQVQKGECYVPSHFSRVQLMTTL